MNSIRKKECKGCSVVKECYMKTWYKHNSVKVYCPCITCLVKIVCSKNCDLITDFGKYLKSPLYCSD